MSVESDLGEATAALARLEERLAGQRAYRDELIERALASGVTWVRVRAITGLSMRGIQLARGRR